jgi:hypothetical protein
MKNKNFFYKLPFEYFFDRIRNNQHFKYSRFNDGELLAINGKNPLGSNCDGHIYFPKMGEQLKEVLLTYSKTDDYFIESFIHWYNKLPHIRNILHGLKEQNNELMFLEDDFIRISHEETPEKFIQLLDVLKNKKMVIVGPEYLKDLNKFFEFRHINVPLKNCYNNINEIIDNIKSISYNEKDIYFLLSASMPANIIIDKFKDNGNNTYLDWGSVWDTFFISPQYSFIRKRSTSNKKEIIDKYKKFLI